jgi:hypothetical protein
MREQLPDVPLLVLKQCCAADDSHGLSTSSGTRLAFQTFLNGFRWRAAVFGPRLQL